MTCPYLGRAMVPKMYASGAWTTTGGYDPAEWQPRAGLEAVLKSRNGRPVPVKDFVCAYTSNPVTIVTRADGLARAEGAFSPAQLWEDKDEMLYDISVRNGVPPAFRRTHTITCRLLEPPPSDPTAGLGLNSELVNDVVKDLLT